MFRFSEVPLAQYCPMRFNCVHCCYGYRYHITEWTLRDSHQLCGTHTHTHTPTKAKISSLFLSQFSVSVSLSLSRPLPWQAAATLLWLFMSSLRTGQPTSTARSPSCCVCFIVCLCHTVHWQMKWCYFQFSDLIVRILNSARLFFSYILSCERVITNVLKKGFVICIK